MTATVLPVQDERKLRELVPSHLERQMIYGHALGALR